MKKRNVTIDILRTIGLFLVIAAHCNFSNTFYELREFDVSLLVYCSGASFLLANSNLNYKDYVLKRFKKLILPVWIFLILFLPVHSYFLHTHFSLPFFAKTFLLTSGGLMFVWVFRVFFVTAFINPVLKKINEKYTNLFLYSLILLLVNDILYQLVLKYTSNAISTIYTYVVTYTISFGVISLLGMYSFFAQKKKKVCIMLISFLLFLSLKHANIYSSLYEAKYPPNLYYISYGIFWSTMLTLVFEKVSLGNSVMKCIKWISENSMTIYMWHIVFFYSVADGILNAIPNGFMLYFYILICSIILTGLQNKILQYWRKKYGYNNRNSNL